MTNTKPPRNDIAEVGDSDFQTWKQDAQDWQDDPNVAR